MSQNKIIFTKEQLWEFYTYNEKCPFELDQFPEIHHNVLEDQWIRKKIPEFLPVKVVQHMNYKNKPNSQTRQRTFSSQSGDGDVQRKAQHSFSETKYKTNYNRKNSNSRPESVSNDDSLKISDDQDKTFVNTNDFAENKNQWKQISNRNKLPSSRPYSQDIYSNENHWKKWSNDTGNKHESGKNNYRVYNNNKNFDRNNNWNRRQNDEKIQNKEHRNSHSYTPSDDIWQEDYETKMNADDIPHYQLPEATSRINIKPLIEQANNWFYKDLSNNNQGPFHSVAMANWFATGHFNYATFVRRECDMKFLMISEYRALYNRIPFTDGEVVPPITMDVQLAPIDAKIITAGVEDALIPLILAQSILVDQKTILAPPVPPQNILEIIEQNNRLERMLQEKEAEALRFKKEREEIENMILEAAQIKVREETQKAQEPETVVVEENNDVEENIINETSPCEDTNSSEENVNGDGWSIPNIKTKKIKNKKIKPTTEVIAKPLVVKKEPDVVKVQPQKQSNQSRPQVKENVILNIPTLLNIIPQVSPVIPVKSLMEIQAEEEAKQAEERKRKESLRLLEQQARAVHSFKDQLLNKTVNPTDRVIQIKPVITSSVPSSAASLRDMLLNKNLTNATNTPTKNIWEVVPPTQPLSVNNKSVLPNSTSSVTTLSSDTNSTQLNSVKVWALKQLARFANENRDVDTVVDLLMSVPNNQIAEMTEELLDNSQYVNKFSQEFIKKRIEADNTNVTSSNSTARNTNSDTLSRDDANNDWMTVKQKPISTPVTKPIVNTTNAKSTNNKNKSKKKKNKAK